MVNRYFPYRSRSAYQSGVGLIEVMVAVFVLAVGMLGIAAMQAMALRNSQSSLERSQAVIQSYSIMDAMRANHAVAITGGYNFPMPADPALCPAPAPDGSLVKADLNDWIESLKATIGEGACGSIDCAGSLCEIVVTWDDSRGNTGSNKYEVVTEGSI